MNKNRYIVPCFAVLLLFILQGCSIVCNHELERKKGMSVYKQITESRIPWQVCGRSVENRSVYLLEMGDGDSSTIIFGGFHGSEISGVQLVFRFAEYVYFEQHPALPSKVIIIPVLNPDGLVRAKRRNANKVDINRNFPTANWTGKYKSKNNFPGLSPASEPETQLVIALLEKYKPQRIISVHAPLKMVNYDGPAEAIAREMARFNNYPVKAEIGYPTPGSFGTFAGREKHIATITLELPKSPFEEIWKDNREALWSTLIY